MSAIERCLLFVFFLLSVTVVSSSSVSLTGLDLEAASAEATLGSTLSLGCNLEEPGTTGLQIDLALEDQAHMESNFAAARK